MVQLEAHLDDLYSALSDQSRRAIIVRLVRGPLSVSELAEPLNMSLTAVAKHVALLEQSGLVVSEKIGRVRTCRIDEAKLAIAQDWLAEQRAFWETRFDRMDAFLLEGRDNE